MTHEFVEELLELNNFAVFDGYAKAQSVIQRCNSAVCCISGGSDSDIVLDIMHNVDENGKEFIIQNPPDFPIFNKCCEYAKLFIEEHDADLDITGIRKVEGGIRSAKFKTCFSPNKSKGCDSFPPFGCDISEGKKVDICITNK